MKFISDLDLEAIEAAVGMGHAAWDTVDPKAIVKAVLEHYAARPEGVTIKLELLDFLSGICALDGVWFGDEHPKYMGKYWWRRYLPDAPQDESPPPMNSGSK